MDIITTATILMSVASLNGNSGSFAYNADINDSIVKSETVYLRNSTGKILTNHLKYLFTYDNQKRLVKKETLKWDAEDERWINKSCYNFIYLPAGYEMDFAYWNGDSRSYDKDCEKQVYTEYTTGSMEVSSYKWNNEDNNWQQTGNNLVLRPNQLTAEEILK